MKFLVVSQCGDFLGAALRLVKEGHDVSLFFPKGSKRFTGLAPHVKTLQEGLLGSPDVVLFDGPGQGRVASRLRSEGHKTIGGGELHDDLAHDPLFVNRALESFGVTTPKTFLFPNFVDAAKFAITHNRRLVLCAIPGVVGEFVGQTNDELVNILLHLRSVERAESSCFLREWVSGPETVTEIWYAQGKPTGYPLTTVTLRKLFHEDAGPDLGIQAGVTWTYPVREPRLVQKSLKKISILLEKKKYSGPLAVRGVVHKERFYALGFCTHFSRGTLYSALPLLGEDFGVVLHRLAVGGVEPVRFHPGFAASLAVSIPPYPYAGAEDYSEIYSTSKDFHVGGVEKDAWGSELFPLDVYAKNEGILSAGEDGRIAHVSGVGLSVSESAMNAEEVFRRLSLPRKQARLGDLARKTERRLTELSLMKYDVPTAYPLVVSEALAPAVPEPKKKEVSHETLSVPAHMAHTTLSAPTKFS